MVNPDCSWERNYDCNISLFDLGEVVSVTMGDKVIGKFATVDEAEEFIAATIALKRASYGEDD